MCCLTLPLLRRPIHVLPSKPLEIAINIVLRVAGDRAQLLYELLYVPAIRILGALTFSLELGLPACLFRQKVRVRSLGRLDRYWLRRIVYWYLEDWLDWSTSVYLECGLGNTALEEFRERIKLLLDALQASSVNGSFNVSLLDKVF